MSSRRLVLAFTFAIVLAMMLGPMARVPAQRAGALDTAVFAEIDQFVEAQRQESRIPGIALAIVERGEVVHARGFGSAGDGQAVTVDTPFPIGSLTKSMTALAIMQLVDAGAIELDAPVQRYLPEFTLGDAEAASRITVRQLLNQTSDLSRATGISWRAGFLSIPDVTLVLLAIAGLWLMTGLLRPRRRQDGARPST